MTADALTDAQRATLAALTARLAGEGDDGPLATVLAAVAAAADADVARLNASVALLFRPVECAVAPDSDLCTAEFVAEFTARLQAHHSTHADPMGRTAFESALRSALAVSGCDVESAPSATTRFWDLRVDGVRFSAKTSAAKGMRRDRIHISKLSEAAWIQDQRSRRSRHALTVALFREFIDTVGRWVMLRVFSTDAEWEYELVEIPMDLFAGVLDVPEVAFDSDAPRVAVRDETGNVLFEVVLDRSDSKVTIGKIDKRRCFVHAVWRVPKAA